MMVNMYYNTHILYIWKDHLTSVTINAIHNTVEIYKRKILLLQNENKKIPHMCVHKLIFVSFFFAYFFNFLYLLLRDWNIAHGLSVVCVLVLSKRKKKILIGEIFHQDHTQWNWTIFPWPWYIPCNNCYREFSKWMFTL